MHSRNIRGFRPRFSLLRENPPSTTAATSTPSPFVSPATRPLRSIVTTFPPTTTTTRTVPTTAGASTTVTSVHGSGRPVPTMTGPPTAATGAIPKARYPGAAKPATIPPKQSSSSTSGTMVPGSSASSAPITSTTASTTPSTPSPWVSTSSIPILLSESGVPTADWKQVWKDWKVVKPFPTVPQGEPVTQDERDWLTQRGFNFIKQLGKGGFGTVWHVSCDRLFKDAKSGNFVKVDLAMKVVSLSVFHPKPGKQKSFTYAVDSFLKEGVIHHQLSHPNIVKCEEVIFFPHTTSGFPMMRNLLLMELMDGNLEDLMKTKFGHRFTTEEEAFTWFWQVCEGLAYLHSLNIVHFDIKTINVMYKKTDQNSYVFKLSDFGLGHRFEADLTHTKLVGTREYCPPEMWETIRGQRNNFLAKPADIYCLGLALIESISGYNFRTTMMAALTQKWDRLSERRWALSAEGVKLVNKLIDKNPDNRPTIEEIQKDPWYVKNMDKYVKMPTTRV